MSKLRTMLGARRPIERTRVERASVTSSGAQRRMGAVNAPTNVAVRSRVSVETRPDSVQRFSAPAVSRPAVSRPAVSRSAVSRSAVSRSAVSRSAVSRSAVSRPVITSAPRRTPLQPRRLAISSARDSVTVVGISEVAVARTGASLITYALGSCVGIVGYDPRRKIAGLLHVLLPHGKGDPKAAASNPATFADTGIPALVRAMERLGANRRSSRFHVAGGASILRTSGLLDVGRRNVLAVRKALWTAGLLVEGEAVGGTIPRTLSIVADTGVVRVQSPGQLEIVL